MFSSKPTCRLLAGFIALTALAVSSPSTSAQQSGPVAFRRDQVPLSSAVMTRLSGDLEYLSHGLQGESLDKMTAAARMLALAMALDPANPKLRKHSENIHSTADPDRIQSCHEHVWRIISWLETEAAGEHGNRLANCLKDVLVVSNPDHPQAVALRESGEKGLWLGWVLLPQEKPTPEAVPGAAEPPLSTEPPPSSADSSVPKEPIALERAALSGLLSNADEKGLPDGPAYSPATLKMSASRSSGEGGLPLTIEIGTAHPDVPPSSMERMLLKMMAEQHGKLPRGVNIQVFSDGIDLSACANLHPISAVAAVLTSAVITGREPEATVIGQMDETGAFSLPQNFWEQLRLIGPGNGRRLVLPSAAAAWLPSLLAMENSAFFLEHEVLLADDFKHLLALTAKTPDADVAQASAQFREIRERLGTQDVGAYLSNRFVRERLESISKSLSCHASATMLLLHGSPDRPRQLSRHALANELLTAIRPMAWIKPYHDPARLIGAGGKFADVYKLSILPIDSVERYVSKGDLALFDRAKSLTKALWSFSRSVRRSEDFHIEYAESQTELIRFGEFYSEVEQELKKAAQVPAP